MSTFYAGQVPTAAELNGIAPAAVDYSASLTLSAVTTPPTKGNSTYAAKYALVGSLVFYSISIGIGSTFVAGSGAYRFSLPVTASAAALAQDIGTAWVNDSGTALRVGVCKLASTSTLEFYLSNITGNAVGDAGPGTAWANSDTIMLSIRYEAA